MRWYVADLFFCLEVEIVGNKIGAYITLDGEREFKSAVQSCNKSLSTLKSEMNLVETQSKGQANSIETLNKKHEVLTKTLEEQKRKEEAVQSGLDHASQSYKTVGEKLENYRKELEQAKQELNEMEKSSDATEDSLENQRETVEKLEKIVENGAKTYQKAGERVDDWKRQLNNAKAETIKLNQELEQNQKYIQEAERAIDKCANSINEFGEATKKTEEGTRTWGESLKRNVQDTVFEAAKSLSKEVLTTAVEGTIELQDAEQKLQASTGATKQEMKEYNGVLQELYSGGYGDTVEDVADAMQKVRQYTNETDPTKIKEVAENAMALQDTFNIDLQDGIRGADSLMKNMGLTSEEAFDYISKGAQNGLNKTDELGDNLAEYTSLWGQAGFSAKEMFAILDNGLTSGAYNLDKVNDFVKEFGISLSDGRIEKNLDSFSNGTKDLFLQWKDGQATTSQVFYSVIADLENMTDQQNALTIASNVWSALGEDNAMKIITSLNDVNTEFENVKGTMESVKNVRYDDVANSYKILGRTFQTEVIYPILQKFLPTAQKELEKIANNIDQIGVIAAATTPIIVTALSVNKVVKFASELKKTKDTVGVLVSAIRKKTSTTAADTVANATNAAVQTEQTAATVTQTTATVAQTVATEGATVAQNALNVSMLANPAVLVTAGLVGLVGVMTLVASRSEEGASRIDELREKTDDLTECAKKAKDALEEVSDSAGKTMEEVEANGEAARNLVTDLNDLSNQLQNVAQHSGDTTQIQQQLSVKVAELNQLFPEMGLSIDSVTGSLSMSTEEIGKYIDKALEIQKAKAAQQLMEESVKALTEAEVEQAKIENQIKTIDDELADIEKKRAEAVDAASKKSEEAEKAQKEYNDAIGSGAENTAELYEKMQNIGEATIEYNGKIMTATEALEQMDEDEKNLTDTKLELKDNQNELNESIDQANAEMEIYTDYIEKKTGATQEDTDATNENTDAAKARIEESERELEAFNNLSAAQQQLAVDVTNGVLTMQENVQSALESQMNMFEQFNGGTEVAKETLLANMQSQVDGVIAWEQNLSSLMTETKQATDGTMVSIDSGLMQYLAEMGPEGAGYVQAFANMSGDELKKANELWTQSVDIKTMTNDWGQQLLTSGAQNIAGSMESITTLMEESGANTVMGLVRGMESAQKDAEVAGKDLGVKTIEATNSGLGCASPSKKTMESGKNVDKGLISGIQFGRSDIQKTVRSMTSDVTETTKNNLSVTNFRQIGLSVPEGLAKGIREGKSNVIQAVTEVTSAAIKTANEKLEINSPSHVFQRIGAGSIEGYVKGVDDNAYKARDSVKNAMNFADATGIIGGKSVAGESEYFRLLESAFENALKKIDFSIYLRERPLKRSLSEMGVSFNG